MEQVLSITGHRPDKFADDYDGVYNEVTKVRFWLSDAFRYYKPSMVIWGGALGVDTWAAEEALDLNIPLHLAIPFEGFNTGWPVVRKQQFEYLRSKCDKVTIVNPGGYRVWYYQTRNEYMVDRSNRLLAVWNGTKGGTWNCITYARKVGRPIDYYPGFDSNPNPELLSVPRQN